ncbi:MAG: hypothetical protein ACRD16_00690 [Thermoanaerobaculia bacterium]
MKTRRIGVATLGAVLLCAGLFPSRALFAESSGKTFLPVPPERDYYKLKHLMGDGMMPNYKALWSAFRVNDVARMRLALGYMSALAREIDRYPPPDKDANLSDFKTRMGELDKKVTALQADFPKLADRAAVSARILSIYGTCQSCHDVFAPEEGKDRRKYSPPPG